MNTKKEYRYFSIFHYEKEQEYLQEQHRLGWKFRKVTGLGTYHFEQCQPETVVYQLDYNQEGSAHRDEYIQMFADCGWEYIQEFAGYSYFRKSAAAMDAEESIFCDESSRLAMMERVYKGRLLPLLLILCSCLLPQFVINLTSGRYFLAALMGSIAFIYILFFAYCAIHYHRRKSKSN